MSQTGKEQIERNPGDRKSATSDGQPANDPLAPCLEEACSNSLFRKCWQNECDLVFKPFAAAILLLSRIELLAPERRQALYHALSTVGRRALLSEFAGRQVSAATVRLLAKTGWPQFCLADWQAFIGVNSDVALGRALARVDRIDPILVHQVEQVPGPMRAPGLLQVLNRLAVPSGFWQRLKTALKDATTNRRTEIIAAADRVQTIADFWDAYFLCVSDPARPFPLAQVVGPHVKLLQPLSTAAEMQAEGLKMQNCLSKLIGHATAGRSIYFKTKGEVQATAELLRTTEGWKSRRILGPRNQPLEDLSKKQMQQELDRLVPRIATAGGSADLARANAVVERLRAWARETFQPTEIEQLAASLRNIRGRSHSETDGAYVIFIAEGGGFVQFMSNVAGDEYLCEILSHKYQPAFGDTLDATAVETIEGAGFRWPLGKENFIRWFRVTGAEDCLGLAELALAILAKVCCHRLGQPIEQKCTFHPTRCRANDRAPSAIEYQQAVSVIDGTGRRPQRLSKFGTTRSRCHAR
jgi:hypothetical protein